jgi:hypothetical protein
MLNKQIPIDKIFNKNFNQNLINDFNTDNLIHSKISRPSEHLSNQMIQNKGKSITQISKRKFNNKNYNNSNTSSKNTLLT